MVVVVVVIVPVAGAAGLSRQDKPDFLKNRVSVGSRTPSVFPNAFADDFPFPFSGAAWRRHERGVRGDCFAGARAAGEKIGGKDGVSLGLLSQ